MLSSPSVACTTFANVCTRNHLSKICGVTIVDLSIGNLDGPEMGLAQTVSSCGVNLQTNHDLAIDDLAIECFGVHAIPSLDVRVHVATNFVKMTKGKKITRNESSKFGSSIPIPLAILRRKVFVLISYFPEYRIFVFLVLVEDR